MRLLILGLLLMIGAAINAQIVENLDSPNWDIEDFGGVEMREVTFASPSKYKSGRKSFSKNRYFTNADGTYNAVATGEELVVILPNGDQLTGFVGKPLTRISLSDFGWELDCTVLEPEKTDPVNGPVDGKSSNRGCIDIYTEVEYNLYEALGDGTADYIDAVLFQVAALAARDQIFFNWSEVLIWDTEDPWTGTNTSEQLQQFSLGRQVGTYNGHLAQLLGDADAPGAPRGGIAWRKVICGPSSRHSFSSIRTVYNDIPVYSWTVMVIAHEIGHNLGSRHTHECAWNGDGTAIDRCGGNACGTDPGIPQDGGTIMSYCHLNPVGINFELGYGPQPGQLMRDEIADAVCDICGVIPEPEPSSCGEGETEVIVEVTFDGRPEDILFAFQAGQYWENFGREWAGQTFRDTVCLTDGCHIFAIGDSYGDGLDDGFCQSGSYRIYTGDTVLVEYTPFTDVAQHEFCLPVEDGESECDFLDLSQARPYGTNQHAGEIIPAPGGVLILRDNAWAAVDVEPFEVENTTVLSFWFKSEARGEIGGIGVDNNEVISSNRSFNLYGSQSWGFNSIQYTTPGVWKYYEITLIDYFDGQYDRITFIADEDWLPDCEYHYFEVSIGDLPCPVGGTLPPDVTVPKSLPITISDVLVFDMLGRRVMPSVDLPVGMYLVKRGPESKLVFNDGRSNGVFTDARLTTGNPE